MSDVKAVRYLLANNAALIAAVPAAKIMAGLIPQGTVLPAIAVSHVSTVRRHTIASGVTEYCISRVQITVMATSYPQQKSILSLVRSALPRSRSTINGVAVDSILSDAEGPDFRDDDIAAFLGSLDFIVTYNE
jgi:hypothetical protein